MVAGTLSGEGQVIADGGNGAPMNGSYAGGGSGGRIAIYYDSADFDFPGLAPQAYRVLYEQGSRGGPIMALERLVQAQSKSIRVILVIGNEKPLYAYHSRWYIENGRQSRTCTHRTWSHKPLGAQKTPGPNRRPWRSCGATSNPATGISVPGSKLS